MLGKFSLVVPAFGALRCGYVRVSSADQNDARQLEGLVVDKTFTDKASGKDTKRPELQAMFEFVREGAVTMPVALPILRIMTVMPDQKVDELAAARRCQASERG